MASETLEPKKYDPNKKMENIDQDEDEDFYSIHQFNAAQDSLDANATFRDHLASKEAYFPPSLAPTKTEAGEQLQEKYIWVLPQHFKSSEDHPTARDQFAYHSELHTGSAGNDFPEASISPLRTHRRTTSNPESPVLNGPDSTGFVPAAKLQHKVSKSLSDPNLLLRNGASVSRSASLRRKFTPSPIRTSPIRSSQGSSGKERLSPIVEQEDYARNYKVQVSRDMGSPTKVVRSPLKKLFGEGGLLGRSTQVKDEPDPRFKKTGIVHWGGKFKQRIGQMGKEISDAIPNIDVLPKRVEPPQGPSKFPVSLSPYEQGDFYMRLELLLNNETNRFITSEFEQGRVSGDSIRKISETWANKGRPQVLAFRYDTSTQRDLVLLNHETLHFGGINAFNRMKLHAVLAAWRILAKEMAVRTFCHPDSAVKKHLHDAERVLELIDASPGSMLAFQDMRSRVVGDIYQAEKYARDREIWNGREVAWSPSRFDNGVTF